MQPALRGDEIDDPLHAVAGLQVGEDEGPILANPPRVALHDIEAGADQRREIGLVDDREVRAGDAGSALAGGRAERCRGSRFLIGGKPFPGVFVTAGSRLLYPRTRLVQILRHPQPFAYGNPMSYCAKASPWSTAARNQRIASL